jgi:hypothetical protein
MGDRGFGVRLFEIQKDGSLEPLLGVDEDHFAGAVPDVGDTYAKWGIDDQYTFFSVQRRIFVDSPGTQGWCVVVREIEVAPQLDAVVREWIADTDFWLAVEEQERKDESDQQAQLEQRDAQRNQNAPRHRLHPREVKTLRFMIGHPECMTLATIRGAAEHTISVLAEAKLVRGAGKDASGEQQWKVTAEGRAEIQRYDLWTAPR